MNGWPCMGHSKRLWPSVRIFDVYQQKTMIEQTYTLEEARLFVVHARQHRPTFSTVKAFQNAVRKALHKLNDPDLWHQYRTNRGTVTRSFLEQVFPAMAESHCKRLVFPEASSSPKEALPTIDLTYTAKVVEASERRELERELAEIYMVIDALDLGSDPFPVDLGEAARWLGYSPDQEPRIQKQNAKAALMSMRVTEGVDYTRMNIHARVNGNRGGGAVTVEQIRLTAECFKKLCLRAKTIRADRVREYFIAAEQRFRAAFKGESLQTTTDPRALENVVRSVVRAEAEQQLTAAVGTIGESLGSVEGKVLSALEVMQQQIESLKADLIKAQTPAVADLKRLHGSLYQQVLEQSYRYPDGLHCPCCNKPTTSWEVDHWNSKTNPARTNGWMVCRPCNQALGAAGDTTKRHHYKARFDAFQIRCDDYEQYMKGEETQLGLQI